MVRALLFRTSACAECVAGQTPTASSPRADVIYLHANVYTGVPSNATVQLDLREEAIAVRGDRFRPWARMLTSRS